MRKHLGASHDLFKEAASAEAVVVAAPSMILKKEAEELRRIPVRKDCFIRRDAVRAEEEYRQTLWPVVVAKIRFSFKDSQQRVRRRMVDLPHLCRTIRRRPHLFFRQEVPAPRNRVHDLALRERDLVENVISPESVRVQFLCQFVLRQPVVGIDKAMRAVTRTEHRHRIPVNSRPRIVHDARLEEIGKRP